MFRHPVRNCGYVNEAYEAFGKINAIALRLLEEDATKKFLRTIMSEMAEPRKSRRKRVTLPQLAFLQRPE
jgi:hypothetical protein